MITIIQTVYIVIFNTIYKLTKHISEKHRNIGIFLCLFALVSLFWVQCSNFLIGLRFNTIHRSNIGMILLVILCVLSVNKPLKKVSWKKWLVYPYFLAAIFMVIASFDHFTGNGYQSYAWQLLVIFPALYFVWNNRKDYEIYYNLLAKAIVFSGTVVIILTFILRPVNEFSMLSGRYMGLSDNSNLLGMIGIIITSASLYLISLCKKSIWFYLIINGIATTFIWLSMARTAVLVLIFQIIAWSIMLIRINIYNRDFTKMLIILMTIVIMIVSVPVFKCVLTNLGEKQMQAYAAETNPTIEERFDIKDKDLGSFVSGRDYLWKYYWDRMTFIGNDCTNHEIPTGSGTALHNAHNTYLEVGFRYGIPAGIFYFVFMSTVLVMMNIGILNGNRKKYSIFVVMAILAYGIESLLDVQTLPFSRGPVLIFYLVAMVLFDGDLIKKETGN